MRQLIVFASLLFFAGLLNAQHGGGGHAGGGSGHAGGGSGHAGFGSGFSHGAVSSQVFSHAAPRFAALPQSSFSQNFRYPQGAPSRAGNGRYARSGQVYARNGRRGGRVGYGGYGYGYGYPLIGYPAFGYDDGFDDGSADQNYQGNTVANDDSAGYGYQQDAAPQGPEEAYGGSGAQIYGFPPPNDARPPYNPDGSVSGEQPQASRQISGSDGLQHPKVTLVFKDGHKLQVQNYALTQRKVLVTDNSTERDIPISALDVNATAAANDTAGVDFPLPGAQ